MQNNFFNKQNKSLKTTILLIFLLIIIVFLFTLLFTKTNPDNNLKEINNSSVLKEKNSPLNSFLSENELGETAKVNNIILDRNIVGSAIPSSLSLYQNDLDLLSNEEVSNQIAKVLELEKDNTLPFEIWRNNDLTMTFSSSTGQYTIDNLFLNNEDKIGDESLLLEKAKGFFEKISVKEGFNFELENTSYMKSSSQVEAITTVKSEANFVTYNFIQKIGSFNLYSQKSLAPPYQITLNAKGEIVKASFIYSDFLIDNNKTTIKETISLENALENVNNNQALITWAANDDYLDFNLQEISSGVLNKYSLEYRLINNSGQIIPFYSFEGVFYDSAGIRFEAIIITPAINLL